MDALKQKLKYTSQLIELIDLKGWQETMKNKQRNKAAVIIISQLIHIVTFMHVCKLMNPLKMSSTAWLTYISTTKKKKKIPPKYFVRYAYKMQPDVKE